MSDERHDAGGTVDLAHEALIGGWPQLQVWVGQRREAEQARRRLEDKVEEWDRLDRKGGLLDEAELAEAERWLASPDAAELGHGEDLAALVEASRTQIAAGRDRELAQARALADEQQRRADVEAEAGKRLRQRLWLLRGVAAIALVTAAAAIVFFIQAGNDRDQAEAEALARSTAEANAQANAEISLSQSLAAQSQVVADSSGEDETAALLAVQSYLVDQGHQQVEGPVGSALQTSAGSPFFSTQSPEHPSMINTLASSQDGQTLAIARDNGSLALRQDGREIPCALPGASDRAWPVALAFNRDGTRLAAGGRDGWVRLWRVGPGACLFEHDLEGAGGAITGVAWGENETAPVLAASGCGIPDNVPPPRFTIAPACPNQTATVMTWPLDPATRGVRADQRAEFPLGSETVCALVSSADGRWLAASPCGVVAGEPDCLAAPGAIALWDVQAPESDPECLPGHTGAVNALAFATCGDRVWLAAGSDDRRVSLWVTDSEARFVSVTALSGQNEAVRSVALSRGCAWLAAGSEDGTTGVWMVGAIMQAGTAVEPPPILIPLGTSTQWVRTVAFGGADGQALVAESTLGRYRQWDLGYEMAAAPAILPGHTNYIRHLAFSPVDGSYVLVSAAEDGTIRLWDPQVGTPVTIAIDEGDPIRPALKIASVAISADGTRLAAGDARNTVRLWDLTDPAAPALIMEEAIECPTDRDAMVAFSPAGDLLAVGGCGGVVQLREPVSGALLPLEVEAGPGRSLTTLAFNHDGSMLAAGDLGGTIAAWSRTGDGFTLLHLEEGAHGGRVWTLAFNPAGGLLASGGPEREVKLWAVSGTGISPQRALSGHGNEVRSVAFSPDGALLFSGSRDQTVRIWDTANLDAPPTVILDLAEWVRAIAISSDGAVLAAASDQGTIRLIVPRSADLARLACERIGREPLSEAEWSRFVGATLPYQDTCASLETLAGADPATPGSDPAMAVSSRRHRLPRLARRAAARRQRPPPRAGPDHTARSSHPAGPSVRTYPGEPTWPQPPIPTTSSSAIATRTRTRRGFARRSCPTSRRPGSGPSSITAISASASSC